MSPSKRNPFRLFLVFAFFVTPGARGSSTPASMPKWSDPTANYSDLRKTWETDGRTVVHSHSGLSWDDSSKRWVADPHWDKGDLLGHEVYDLESPLRGGVEMGAACHDLPLLNELSQFLVAFSTRFTTLGEMKGKEGDKTQLKGQGSDNARTFAWIQNSGGKQTVSECTLCTAQFFHPVSRLIRVISGLRASERSPAMQQLVKIYTPLIVRDHLLRLLYQAEWNHWNDPTLPKTEVEVWRTLRNPHQRPQKSYQHAMLDTDLWMIATAAEMLGAHTSDSSLVSISSAENSQLRDAVRDGAALFQSKGTFDPGTKNFKGTIVGSVSYFNGDLDDHPDSQYSGVTSAGFPDPSQKKSRPNTSWDISHAYRIPVFLRALYDNKKATGLNFPEDKDIQLATNQYVYRVFQGNLERPLFNNYFDGSNGWYRVAYHGGGFGYPPAQYCDAHSSDRPCLIAGALDGWGLLAFANPDLQQLEHSLLKLAADQSSGARQFANRYYWYANEDFKVDSGKYPKLLFSALSDMPQVVQGCPVPMQELRSK